MLRCGTGTGISQAGKTSGRFNEAEAETLHTVFTQCVFPPRQLLLPRGFSLFRLELTAFTPTNHDNCIAHKYVEQFAAICFLNLSKHQAARGLTSTPIFVRSINIPAPNDPAPLGRLILSLRLLRVSRGGGRGGGTKTHEPTTKQLLLTNADNSAVSRAAGRCSSSSVSAWRAHRMDGVTPELSAGPYGPCRRTSPRIQW